jgi:hypothetical protein
MDLARSRRIPVGPRGSRLVEVREGASLKDCPLDLKGRYYHGPAKKPDSHSNYFAGEAAAETGCAFSNNSPDFKVYGGVDIRPYSPDSLKVVSRPVALLPISGRSLHLFSSSYHHIFRSAHINSVRSGGSLS